MITKETIKRNNSTWNCSIRFVCWFIVFLHRSILLKIDGICLRWRIFRSTWMFHYIRNNSKTSSGKKKKFFFSFGYLVYNEISFVLNDSIKNNVPCRPRKHFVTCKSDEHQMISFLKYKSAFFFFEIDKNPLWYCWWKQRKLLQRFSCRLDKYWNE